MNSFKTEQEEFWAGDFGDEYIGRNRGKNIVIANIALFSKILSRTVSINSILEYGANIGLNLKAIRELIPVAQISAIEINKKAVEELNKLKYVNVFHESVLDYEPDILYDFVFIKGVLIHIKPDFLPLIYERLYTSSKRYICLMEYYNPTPVEVTYRGHSEKLYKRDFAGEIMDKYPDLQLIDYRFVYKRDNVFPLGDFTWFLLEKR